MQVLARHAMEKLAYQDGAELATEEAREHIMSAPWDKDTTIRKIYAAKTRDEARRRSRRSNLAVRPTNSSPPASTSERPHDSNALNSSPNTPENPESPSEPAISETQPPNHGRAPSRAEYLAESLKENTGQSESSGRIRRPDGQSRGFGNDLTQFDKDERRRAEDVAANRQP